TDRVVASGIFALAVKCGDGGDGLLFSDWKFGFFDNNNVFSSVAKVNGANFSSTYVYAGVFGTLGELYAHANAFMNWKFDGFGNDILFQSGVERRGRFKDKSATLSSCIFGLQCNAQILSEQDCSFSNWKLGKFGNKNIFSSQVIRSGNAFSGRQRCAYAGVFGARCECDVYCAKSFAAWEFDGFGNCNKFLAKAIDGGYIVSAGIFGMDVNGEAVSNSAFANWRLGCFGHGNCFSVVAKNGRNPKKDNAGIRHLTNTYGSIFGSLCKSANVLDGDNPFGGWTFGGFGNCNDFRVDVHGASGLAAASLFGLHVDSDDEDKGASFHGWEIGTIGDGNRFIVSVCNASNNMSVHAEAYGGIFGTTAQSEFADGNPFSDWTFDGFGNYNTFAARVVSMKGKAFAGIFGMAGKIGFAVAKPFCHWFVGPIGDHNSFTATASGGIYSFATVFGSGFDITKENDEGKIFNDWSMEMQGSQTVAALSYAPSPQCSNATAIGGALNENMRFYINGKNAIGPVVVNVVAAKLENDWEFDSGAAMSCISNTQGDDNADGWRITGNCVIRTFSTLIGSDAADAGMAKAVALGPKFQLNIGRTRALTHYVDGDGIERTRETDGQIKDHGGMLGGGAGTLNLIGAVTQAAYNTNTEGSHLRIDSGWTVNCFSPVQDVESTEILHGCMVLMANDLFGQKSMQTAMNQVNESICVPQTDDDGNGDSAPKTYGRNCCASSSTCRNCVSIDASNYPILGRLTVDNASGKNQKVLFGTVLRKNNRGDIVHHVAGRLVLCSSDANTYGPQLQLLANRQAFALQLTGTNSPYAGPVNALVVSMLSAENPNKMSALFSVAGETLIFGDQLFNAAGQPTPYYFISDSKNINLSQSLLLDMSLDLGYAGNTANDLRLLWLNGDPQKGVVIASVQGNTILKEELDPVFFAPLRFSPGDDSFDGEHFFFFNGELASMLLLSNELQFNHLRDHCAEGNHLGKRFIYSAYSRISRSRDGTAQAFTNNMYCIGLGGDVVRQIGMGKSLRYGVCVSYSDSTLCTLKLPDSLEKTANQPVVCGTIYASRRKCSDNSLGTNILASITCGSCFDKIHRTDVDFNRYKGKMDAWFASIRGEGTHNTFRRNGLCIGPWLCANYTFLRQDSYGERGTGQELSVVPVAIHHSIGTTLGINFEQKCAENSTRCCGRIGCEYLALRHCHTSSCASIQGTELEKFDPRFAFCGRTLFRASISLHKNICARWNLCGTWDGNFGNHVAANSLSVKLFRDF
ncbi:MAG: autotransporter outer membrane beta-barrel domain-containing protein, partial [Puniceicoccales bacterium]|nr:autotransporter outer membrane beta-barrel domain-containing protein [Puniceicoccales bacterium]